MFKIITLILFILFVKPVYGQEGQNVVPETATTQESIVQFNDELRKTTQRILTLESGISLTSQVTGILPTANGGFGANMSTASQYSIPYFSSTGVIGNIGIGTSGQFLTAGAPPSYTTLIQNVAAYNTSTPLYRFYTDANMVYSSGGSDNNPTSSVYYRSPVFGRSGTVNVCFRAKAENGAATGQAYVRKNGTQVGTTRVLQSTYSTFCEDLTVALGDYFDVYASVCTNDCRMNEFYFNAGNPIPMNVVENDGTTVKDMAQKSGHGSPTTNGVACIIGDIYMNLDGGASTTLYVCTATDTWTAK